MNRALTIQSAYEAMARIRRLEERVLELSAAGEIAGSVHPCLGQEAIPVGAVAALEERDRIIATYRGHGWALACGSTPEAVLGEILQRAGGTNGGRAGSPLLSDPDVGFLGENSIVGAGVPVAGGVALAAQVLGTGGVTVVSIGDGAMNQGATTEGMVLAAAKGLPVVYICENNGWAEMTPTSTTMRTDSFIERGTALGIESRVVDGLDPFAVEDAVTAAAETCRGGGGPVLLECRTVRLSGHYNRDVEHYRPKEDKTAAKQADPLTRLRRLAVGELGAQEQQIDEIDRRVESTIDAATEAARRMPVPDTSDVLDHLYGETATTPVSGTPESKGQEMTYQRAVNLALRTELENRPELVVYGEDVGVAGGIFGVTRGLQKDFGPQRVFDTPICESAILGSAVGSAMQGLRPVVEIMWADFVFVALDQLINQAANVRYVNRSRLSAPMTVRMQQGVTPGSCAQHSQSIEAFLAHVPGLKVGLPATPQDAYDMLRAAVADPDPTVVIETRSLYQEKGLVRTGAVQSVAGARTHRTGSDLAIITWGSMVHTALAAAELLEEEGIDATVLDLRWVRPLDEAAIDEVTVRCGGRVVVAHEATRTAGLGAEIAAGIQEREFGRLAGPVLRVGTPDVRMPSAPALQKAVLPGVEVLYAAAKKAAEFALAGESTIAP